MIFQAKPAGVNASTLLGRDFKMIGDAVFEEKAGWRVVPIIGRDEGEYPSWVFD